MLQPKISIGIPFTIWNNLIEESVEHCLQLDYPNFVIVIVPNEGEIIPEKYLNNPQIIIQPTKKTGIAHKRNTALHACDADFYACLDSDSYPKTDWLKNMLKAFSKSPDIGAVGGPNISPNYESLKRQAVANALKSFFVTGPRVFCKRYSSDRYVNDLQTCNLIISKKTIDLIGSFDESLITAEDSNMCGRIIRGGKKIYFAKDVVVLHHNRSLFLQFVKQKIVFGYAVIPFLKKNFGIKTLFHLMPISFVLYALFGWTIIWISKPLFIFWLIIMALYLFIAIFETIKWSSQLKEAPLTFIALIIGNTMPGFGTIISLLKIKLNFNKFYTNYDQKKFNL